MEEDTSTNKSFMMLQIIADRRSGECEPALYKCFINESFFAAVEMSETFN